ncbi:SDR family oxidoreductase [Roseiconus nitratireducens]|uniref:SDR family oxidoreductase n=1 Tax=Roseiconus nitratireducens TaxID=2605748 RepID=A0A5M6CUU8_9BACT|nr:SDR family oxidoreductase [Roseiconus nitratireducens]KAA5539018.1 SDR family oxidoreductase [Roseiconus nitratireducens]
MLDRRMAESQASATSLAPLAVVTGAGNGIGASFAEHFFRQGYRLLMVDVCPEKLDRMRQRLLTDNDATASSRIECHVADLTDRAGVERLADRLQQRSDVEVLVNNAGFGSLVEFLDVDVDRHADMIAIHVETPTRLVHAVLPQMRSNNRGSIVNVASLAAFAPCAQSVMYCSTKAYLVVFSEALREELRGTNIRVQALCPGFVRTDFHAADAMQNFHRRRVPDALWTTPDHVAFCSLQGLSKGNTVVIPGWRSRMLGLFMRMVLIKPIVRVVTRPKSSVVAGRG